VTLTISDQPVSLDKLLEAENILLSNDEAFRQRLEAAHRFLMETIEAGKPIYGVTTGYGESGKNYLTYQEATRLQQNLYRFHGCGVGPYLSEEESRFCFLIRLVSLSKGYSAVSIEMLERMALLLQKRVYPLIPSQGSVGASGDLTPLSYIAAIMAGEREVWFEGRQMSAAKALEALGIEPYRFKPKEALAIMNGTAAMSAVAAAALPKFERLLKTTESFVAGIFEVLIADRTPLEPFVHQVKPHPGQIKSAQNILAKIEGSGLTHSREERYEDFFTDDSLNIQDRYSIRCVPQVLGVVWENIDQAASWVETEMNSVNDNPLIDIKERKIYTSGNFYGGYVAHAMDTLRICLANMADLLDKEFSILVDYKFNRGLGENLKLSQENYYHGFKAMQITLSSLSADVMMNILPASVFSRSTESMNQDKVSMGTTAALRFSRALPDYTRMLAIALLGLAQAVDIRQSDAISPALKRLHDMIRSKIDPLVADRRMDGEIETIVEMIEKGDFE
jgi:histidine ammonia-lyase